MSHVMCFGTGSLLRGLCGLSGGGGIEEKV